MLGKSELHVKINVMGNMVSESRKERFNDAFLNSYAIQVFRDIADCDFIAARQSFRSSLYLQFVWLAQQSIEKYLKCILPLNKIEPIKDKNGAVKGTHSLKILLEQWRKENLFKIRIRKESLEFIDYLDRFAIHSRYLSAPIYVRSEHLTQLDATVWDIRRYCKPLNYSIQMLEGKVKSFLEDELEKIIKSEDLPPQKFVLDASAFLEKIINDKYHPAREFLIWKNKYFGKRVNRNIEVNLNPLAIQSELSISPHMVDVVGKHVFLAKEVAIYLKSKASDNA